MEANNRTKQLKKFKPNTEKNKNEKMIRRRISPRVKLKVSPRKKRFKRSKKRTKKR